MIQLKKFYHVEESHFSDEWCDKVIDFVESGQYRTDERNASFRLSEVIFFPDTHETSWIYNPVYDLVESVKSRNWRTFKLDDFQNFQYTIYNSPGGKYDWHCDTGQPRSGMDSRLLSIVVQLTDPDTYEGGGFEIVEGMAIDLNKVIYSQIPNPDDVKQLRPPRGSVTIFPSVVQHRVLPMKNGTRKSLVGWCNGRFI